MPRRGDVLPKEGDSVFKSGGVAQTKARVTPRRLVAPACLVAAVFSSAAEAAAEAPEASPSIHVQLRDGDRLPFSQDQLLSSVAARVRVASQADGGAVLVTVAPVSGGEVEVASPLRHQRVTLAGHQAVDAARLVALAVVDVVRDPAAHVPVTSAPPAAASLSSALENSVADRAHTQTLPDTRLVMLLSGAAGLGAAPGQASFEPTLTVEHARATSLSLAAAPVMWGLGVSLGYARSEAAFLGRDFALQTWPLRLGPRLGWRWLTVSGGGTLRIYRTTGLDGGRGALVGGFLGIKAAIPIAGAFRAVLGAACDAYTDRLVFQARLLPVMRTEFLMPSLGGGIEWGRW